MKKPTVKLNNGKEVLLEDFVKWHHTKQHKLTIPLEEKKKIYEKSHAKLRRAVNTPMGQFASFTEATKALGLTDSGLRNYIRNTALPQYSYVNTTPEDISKQFHKELSAGSKKTVTPIGIFNSRIAASKALGIEDHQLKKLIKEYPNEYYYSDEQTNIGKRNVLKKEKPKLKFKFLRKIVTPKGEFTTKNEATIALKITSEEFEILLQSKPNKYFIKKKRVSL
jgi:hypothetical protein